jgi:hypothetical protein
METMNHPTPNGMPETVTAVADLNFAGATQSYTGRDGYCCCGCAGNHSKTKTAITRQINNITRLVRDGHVAEAYHNHVAVRKDGRLYIVYFD